MMIIKRIFDLSASILLLIILCPILMLIITLIFLILGKPIFYKQIRCGYKLKPFLLYKFRTMHEKFNFNGVQLPDNERVSRFGKFLRKTSLDELPQLFNVIIGDMSLVGPRPLLMEYIPLYSKKQIKRHNVLPGITGWAQINGRNFISWEKKFELDLWYVNNQSYLIDIKIILITILKVFRGEGISNLDLGSNEKFKG